MMLVFGVVGYVFKKLDYPLAPLVLALVLGDMAERFVPPVDAAARRATSAIFWSNRLVGIITDAGAGDAVLAADLEAARRHQAAEEVDPILAEQPVD